MSSHGSPATSRRRFAVQRNLTNPPRLGLLVVLAATLPLIAACTTANSQPSSVTDSPVLPTTSVASTPTARAGQLSCGDAYTTEPRGSQPVFTASGVAFEALSEAGFDPVTARRGGLSPATGYFSKSPVYLGDGVTWAEVTAIQGDITFVWVPYRTWTNPSGWSVATWEAATARFESCNGSHTGFLGAVRTPRAHECVTLGVRSNLHPEVEAVRIAIGKGACD